jgi:hypothetical protein
LPLVSACSFEVAARSAWVTDHALVEECTAAREAELAVAEGVGNVQVTLSAHVDAGSASWSLVDPEGVVRWGCRAGGGGRVDQELNLPAVPGRWLVRREWQGFSGGQELVVKASGGERLQVRVTPVSADER